MLKCISYVTGAYTVMALQKDGTLHQYIIKSMAFKVNTSN
uniref:Uncharacterized protein n=1 Tax=Anguilla anguilla TaxID=7936 RepID=A0A0E9VJB1_ANGAN